MPRTKITSAFKAPRQVTGQERSSEKDEADVPLVTGRRHRKDNSEWGKRMEKELAQIDKRTEAAQKKTATPKTKLLSEREADEMAKTGDVNTFSGDSDADAQKTIDFSTGEAKDKDQECDRDKETSNKHKDAVGKKIAKDFGAEKKDLGKKSQKTNSHYQIALI
jgi:hypothetical protein